MSNAVFGGLAAEAAIHGHYYRRAAAPRRACRTQEFFETIPAARRLNEQNSKRECPPQAGQLCKELSRPREA
jgi:hypothetical protein